MSEKVDPKIESIQQAKELYEFAKEVYHDDQDLTTLWGHIETLSSKVFYIIDNHTKCREREFLELMVVLGMAIVHRTSLGYPKEMQKGFYKACKYAKKVKVEKSDITFALETLRSHGIRLMDAFIR